jgi:fatty aldehyde decarbonylase
MQQLEINPAIDFHSDAYKDAYSRINAIVIEGEQEAFENYQQLAEMLPDAREQLLSLSKMENRHKKGFQACGKNLQVTPDMDFATSTFPGPLTLR